MIPEISETEKIIKDTKHRNINIEKTIIKTEASGWIDSDYYICLPSGDYITDVISDEEDYFEFIKKEIENEGIYIALAIAYPRGGDENNTSITTRLDNISITLPKDSLLGYMEDDYGILVSKKDEKYEITFAYDESISYGHAMGYRKISSIENKLTEPLHRILIKMMSETIIFDEDIDFKYWLEKANDLIKQKKYTESLKYYDKAIESNPTESLLWYIKGRLLIDLNCCEEAIEHLNKAFELNPSYVKSLSTKGIAYEKLGEYEKAIKCYDEAMTLEPRDDYAYALRGTLHLIHIIDYEKAIKYLNQAKKLNPKNSMTWNNLGDAYLNIGEFEKGLDCCRKARTLNPNNFRAWFTTGEIYYELKDYDKAMEYAIKANEINSFDLELLAFINKVKKAIDDEK